MRTETEMIGDIKDIVTKYIDNFNTEVISRRIATVSSLHTVFAIVFKDKSISSELIKDLIEYTSQNDRNGVSFETKKDLGNLDFEVILVSAEIFYI